jgi:hypothetical protein
MKKTYKTCFAESPKQLGIHLRLLYAGHTLCGSWVATDDEEKFTFGRTVTCLECLVKQQQLEAGAE